MPILLLSLSNNGGHYLFQVISRRYENSSIILTSNKTFAEGNNIIKIFYDF
ncbi:ATP-binding protein [Pseudalkalibacillus sp. R45]|uniref:ATP-binding protein n=1 Tax=Pseudalkalibacillus sp. R45 TaxID=3457433 RepID=UPI003FCDD532